MNSAGEALAVVQRRVQALEEFIHQVKLPQDAAGQLDKVRFGIHEINEAYINYATWAWEEKAEFKLDVV